MSYQIEGVAATMFPAEATTAAEKPRSGMKKPRMIVKWIRSMESVSGIVQLKTEKCLLR